MQLRAAPGKESINGMVVADGIEAVVPLRDETTVTEAAEAAGTGAGGGDAAAPDLYDVALPLPGPSTPHRLPLFISDSDQLHPHVLRDDLLLERTH